MKRINQIYILKGQFNAFFRWMMYLQTEVANTFDHSKKINDIRFYN